MEEKVRSILKEWLKPKEKVILGISGGADSVALAHIVHTEGFPMELVHINFHLRDNESDRDEDFVRNLHKQYFSQHHLQVFDVDTVAYAKEKGISIEMAARDLRYNIFHEIAEEKSIQWILVGHHADDQIETALLNLSRGTGGAGIAGMEIANDQHILRPMLGIWRSEILEYMSLNEYDFCTDSTNNSTEYKRNMIRHKVLPLMEKLNPSFKESLLKSMNYFRDEQKVLNHFAEIRFNDIYDAKCNMIDFSKVGQSPHSLFLLNRKFRAMNFTSTQAENILHFNNNEKCTTYSNLDGSCHLQIYRGLGFFYTHQSPSEVIAHPIRGAGIYELEGIGTLSIGGFEQMLSIDASILRGKHLLFRTANKEDVFQPFGMKQGKKKLFRYLGEKGIPECYRELWPVISLEKEIIAVLPFEISEKAKVIQGKGQVNIAFYPSHNTFGHIIELFSK